MAEKVYCIVKRGGNYYIPVKAKNNPHSGNRKKEAYLACLPNFFGGGLERGEGCFDGLAREVWEESQKTIFLDVVSLDENNVRLLYQCRVDGDNYSFYLVTVTEEGDYFGENHLNLGQQDQLDPSEREMSCILKIPVANDLAGKDVNAFLTYCKTLGENLVNIDQNNSNRGRNRALMHWMTHDGTKDAFKVLFGLR